MRLRGSGLGNLLLTWARAHALAAEHGGAVVRPVWPQVRPRTLLWQEGPPRLYLREIRTVPGEWSRRDLVRWSAASDAATLDEEGFLAERPPGPAVVTVRGLGDMFDPLVAHRDLVRQLLRAAAPPRPGHGPPAGPAYAAVHVRLGDFKAPVEGERSEVDALTHRTSLERFVEVARPVADEFDRTLVFTDGRPADVAPLLSLPGASFVPRRWSTMSTIWAMAEAAVLVPSQSTFSAWAAFLGDAKIVPADPIHPRLASAFSAR